jgi:hypothetical protein
MPESGVILESMLVCLERGVTRLEIMPVDSCQYFYECTGAPPLTSNACPGLLADQSLKSRTLLSRIPDPVIHCRVKSRIAPEPNKRVDGPSDLFDPERFGEEMGCPGR